jgi:hypothetical protein
MHSAIIVPGKLISCEDFAEDLTGAADVCLHTRRFELAPCLLGPHLGRRACLSKDGQKAV